MTKPTYKYEQHPHVEARKTSKPVARKRNKLAPLNDRIGLGITKRVGTMWAAYAFFALTLVSLPAAIATGNTITIVAWVAQTFLQLVLLPIIIVGQNLQAAESEKRAIATYEDAGAILDEAREIQAHLSDQDKALTHLVERIGVLESQLKADVIIADATIAKSARAASPKRAPATKSTKK
jgi:hypothetical protein